jgi:hypothetical protein
VRSASACTSISRRRWLLRGAAPQAVRRPFAGQRALHGYDDEYPMAPETWTDERLDDLAAALRPLPEQVAGLVAAVDHLADETKAMRVDLSASQRQIAQIGWGLVAALLGALAALIVALAI